MFLSSNLRKTNMNVGPMSNVPRDQATRRLARAVGAWSELLCVLKFVIADRVGQRYLQRQHNIPGVVAAGRSLHPTPWFVNIFEFRYSTSVGA